MMDCKKLTDDLLLDHAEQALARDERKRVAHHLKNCVACSARFDEVSLIARTLKKQAAVPAPEQIMAGLDESVMRAIRAPRPGAGRNLFYAFLGVAAAAALIAGIVAWAIHHQPEGEPNIVRDPKPPTERILPKPEIVDAPRPTPEPKPEPKPVQETVNKHMKPEPPAPEPEKKPDPVVGVPKPEITPEPPKPIPTPEPKPVPTPAALAFGDLNGDGKVDIADRMILTSVMNDGDEIDLKLADLNGDGKIDVADAQMLAQLIADQP